MGGKDEDVRVKLDGCFAGNQDRVKISRTKSGWVEV